MNQYVQYILNQLDEFTKRYGLPGDFNNRVNQSEMWLVEFGVKQNQTIWNEIFKLITGKGVWQGRTRNYISQLADEQKTDETITKVKDLNKNFEELQERTRVFINETLPNYNSATQTVSQKITANYLVIGIGIIGIYFIYKGM